MATLALPARPRPAGLVRPLLLTADPQLLDDLLRLAAAAGTDVEVAPDPAGARAPWPKAPLVLVGDDVSAALARARLRRRAGVVLVGREVDEAEVDGAEVHGAEVAGIWQRAVAVGAEHVALLPAAEPWLIGRLSDADGDSRPAGTIVGVVGGRGGAGASTFAAGLAVTGMRHGRRTMLVDADPLGGGVDLLFGGESAAGLRWPDLVAATGRIDGLALHAELPTTGALAVLSWDRGELVDLAPTAMASVLDAAVRNCDLVVVDVGRQLDEAGRVAVAASDLIVLVVPAEVRAAAAAARVAGAIHGLATDVRLVVRGPSPGGLAGGDVAASLGLPLAGWLKPEPDLAAAIERGEAPAGRGVGPLARLCERLLAELTVLAPAS